MDKIEPTERDREMAEEVNDRFAMRGLGCLPSETIWHIGAVIARARAEADAAGYARAREQAAKVADRWSNNGRILLTHSRAPSSVLATARAAARGLAAAIRAMEDK